MLSCITRILLNPYFTSCLLSGEISWLISKCDSWWAMNISSHNLGLFITAEYKGWWGLESAQRLPAFRHFQQIQQESKLHTVWSGTLGQIDGLWQSSSLSPNSSPWWSSDRHGNHLQRLFEKTIKGFGWKINSRALLLRPRSGTAWEDRMGKHKMIEFFFPILVHFCPLFVQIAQMESHFAQNTTSNPCSLLSRHTPFLGYVRAQNTTKPTPKHHFFWPELESGAKGAIWTPSGDSGLMVWKVAKLS